MNTDHHLSRRERQIMDVLHARGQATAAEVLAALPDPPSYSAVRALLRILEEKGHVKHHRDGARYVYLPRVSKEAASKSALRRGDERFRSSLGHAPGRRLHRRQFYKLRRLAAALLLRVASHYDPAQKYPLLCWLHGSPGDETSIVTPNTVYSNGQPLAASSPLKVFASLGRQQTDPGILL